ncbi:MAG: hypothetical protein ACREBG_18615 [Pyrinomonadaceae bacterium]
MRTDDYPPESEFLERTAPAENGEQAWLDEQEAVDAEAAYYKQLETPQPKPGRLARLWNAEPNGERARRDFHNYFIGALSVLVGDEVWDECLKSAGHLAEKPKGD